MLAIATLLLYLIASIVFAPQMYTQYLYIPLIASIIYLNWKYFIYIVLTSLLFLVDGDQLNLQIFSNFFDWDLKSTRITFYPIIFILLIVPKKLKKTHKKLKMFQY